MTNIFVFLIYLTYTDSKLIAFYYLSLRFEDKLETLKKKKKGKEYPEQTGKTVKVSQIYKISKA